MSTSKTSLLTKLQGLTKHFAYLIPVAIGIINVLLATRVFHWNVDTIALVNGLLAASGLGSLHINSL